MLTGGLSMSTVALRSPEGEPLHSALADIAPAACPARYAIGSIYNAGFQNVVTATLRPPRPRKTRCWSWRRAEASTAAHHS